MNVTKTLNGETGDVPLSFNLVDEPWIPVTDKSGATVTVGLRKLYKRSKEWSDLAVGTLETIAIMRLLLCVAQRGLDGPKNDADWSAAGGRLISASVNYLDQWKERFDLYGEKPFLQIKSLKSTKAKKHDDDSSRTDKLDFALATGDSSKTLFDQNAISEGRVHDPDWLARKLLVFQSFSPGSTIGAAEWNGIITRGGK